MVPKAQSARAHISYLDHPGLPQLVLYVQVGLHDVGNKPRRACGPDVSRRNIWIRKRNRCGKARGNKLIRRRNVPRAVGYGVNTKIGWIEAKVIKRTSISGVKHTKRRTYDRTLAERRPRQADTR